MNSRSKFWKRTLLALAALLSLILLGLFLFGKDVEVRVDEETAQAAIDKTVSEGPINRLGIEIDPKRVEIEFSDDGRVGIDANLALEGFGRSGTLDGLFRSGIRYSDGRFYLDNIAPLESRLTLDSETQSEVSDIARLLQDRLLRERENASDNETAQALDRIVDINRDRIEAAASEAAQTFFGSIPIYDLRNAGAGGAIAQLALKDVRFEENEAIMTLSPQLAVAKIVTFIMTLLLMGGYVLINTGLLSPQPRHSSEDDSAPKSG